MPWNEPGSGNSNDRDPWGNGNKNRGNKSPDIEEVINNVRKRFGGGNNGSSNNGGLSFKSQFLIGLIVLVGFVVVRSFYTVQEGYKSIELRFGKYHETVGPGLQFALWPIEKQITIGSKIIRTVEKETPTMFNGSQRYRVS